MHEGSTVITSGSVHGLRALKEALASRGLAAEIVCPPGTNTRG